MFFLTYHTKLPAEIIDYTFSFLQSDPAALKSCSAAHPLLSSLAERYLFAHIIIYFGIYQPPTDGFLVPQLASYLSDKPYLAKYIRSIIIDTSSISYNFYSSLATSSNFDNLSTLLPLITHSEQLSLCGVWWSGLSTKFQLALLDFLKTDHMKALNLRYSIGFPLALLDDLKNIKNLTVGSSYCIGHTAHPIPTSLESLSIVDVMSVDGLDRWAGPRLNTLVSLHVKLLYFWNLSSIFAACSGSLTSLTLEIGSRFQTIATHCRGIYSGVFSPLDDLPFTLSSLTSLELITIYADISAWQSTSGTYGASYFCVSSLLAITQLAATAGPSLKHAVLNLDCSLEVVLDLRDAVEWGPLVQLCDLPINPQVDLCIHVSTVFRVDPSFSEVVESLVENEHVSKLVERGSVVIKPFFPMDLD